MQGDAVNARVCHGQVPWIRSKGHLASPPLSPRPSSGSQVQSGTEELEAWENLSLTAVVRGFQEGWFSLTLRKTAVGLGQIPPKCRETKNETEK